MRTAPLLITLVVASALVGCDADGDDWDPDAQFAPSLRPAVGARAGDGDLALWTGTPCAGVTRVALTFTVGDDTTTWEVRSRRERGGRVVLLRFPTPPRGFRVTEPVPEDFDWAEADEVSFSADAYDGVWGTTTDLDVVRDESESHPGDEYYFDQVGWLDREAVAQRNGEDFLTPCTPDPA